MCSIDVLLAIFLVPLSALALAIVAQELRYLRIRRKRAWDRQALFHSGSVFHVVSLLKLSPQQDLLEGVRDFVSHVERDRAQVVYAGKAALNGRTSSQLPEEEWDAFLVTQYPSRAAWDAASTTSAYQELKDRFTKVFSVGMKRNALINLVIPLALLRQRVSEMIRREPRRYPFRPAPRP